MSFGATYVRVGHKIPNTINTFVLVSFVFGFVVLPLVTVPVTSRTVCDVIYEREHVIQGVVFLGKTGLMFVNDLVYEFDSEADFNSREHYLYIRSSGVHVEKYFDGIYLKGNKIFNVYSLFANETRMLFFVVTNNDDNMVFGEKSSGFTYELMSHKSYEIKNSVVAKDFPFIYFGNNLNFVYLYQIPSYTFGLNPREELNRNHFAYFSFNNLDQKMEYHVAHNDMGKEELAKTLQLLHHKLILRSALTFRDHVYLITETDVYTIKEKDMKTNALPPFQKKKLPEFLRCDPSSSVEAVNWSKIITILLSAVLIIIIFVLIFAITSPKGQPGNGPKRPKSSEKSLAAKPNSVEPSVSGTSSRKSAAGGSSVIV